MAAVCVLSEGFDQAARRVAVRRAVVFRLVPMVAITALGALVLRAVVRLAAGLVVLRVALRAAGFLATDFLAVVRVAFLAAGLRVSLRAVLRAPVLVDLRAVVVRVAMIGDSVGAGEWPAVCLFSGEGVRAPLCRPRADRGTRPGTRVPSRVVPRKSTSPRSDINMRWEEFVEVAQIA